MAASTLPNLPVLQADFLAHIRAENAPSDGFWAGDIAAGLQVYRHAYRARLHDCLSDIYEKLHLWLGDVAFAEATAAYIDRYPPTSWSLDVYGEQFAQFLEGRFPDDSEVAELAWLERTMREAFVTKDPTVLTASTFAARTADYGEEDWHSLRLDLSAIFAYRCCHSNAAAIWSALDQEETPPAATTLAEHWLIVWRRGLTPSFQSFDQAESTALLAMHEGLSFGELCQQLAHDSAEAAANRAGGYLAHWIELELVSDLMDSDLTDTRL